MKKSLFTAVLLITALFSVAQNVKGYYISASGQKTEGYFKNTDFTDISLLRFSQTENGEYTRLAFEAVKEYAVNGRTFTKYLIDIDADGGSNKVAMSKEADFVKKEVFLEQLLEGNISLYVNTANDVEKFFYKATDDTRYLQLIYRKYKKENGVEAENTEFRRQLAANFLCKGESPQVYAKTAYGRKALTEVFKHYNTCMGYQFKVPQNEVKSNNHFAFSVYGGVIFSNFETAASSISAKANTANFKAGAEVSFYNDFRGLSIFARLGAENVNATTKQRTDYQPYYYVSTVSKASFLAFDVSAGPRYTFTINDKKKLYIDGAVAISLPAGGNVKVDQNTTSLSTGNVSGGTIINEKAVATMYFSFSAGYMITNNISAEVRYLSPRDYLANTEAKFTESGVNLNVIYRFL